MCGSVTNKLLVSGLIDHVYDVPECNTGGVSGDDYMAIYETIDRKRQDATSRDLKGKSHSMEALETPEPSLKSFDANIVDGDGKMVSETSNNRRRHRFVDLYELDRTLRTKEVLLNWIAPITYQMYTLTFSNSPIKSAAIL